MQNYKIVAYLLLGYFWLVREEFVDNKGFLSHLQLGAVAKADQYFRCLASLAFRWTWRIRYLMFGARFDYDG